MEDENDWKNLSFACFFHDAVYVPGAKDNEAQSEELFTAFSEEVGLTGDIVKECIRCSQDHVKYLSEASELVRRFLELDLSILAATPHRYLEYANAIRQEYFPMVVDEKTFKTKRVEFLKTLLPSLDRDEIFTSEELNELAAVNVEAEITRLSD
jgi:predicted metal-dependent HD superfamily phosphohydrolase